jgi:hypothetical protein
MDGIAAQPAAHLLLRERTRAAHEAAETTAGMRALMAGAMDETGYRELLSAQLRLFRAWETERAADLAATAALWPYASRIPALETDTTPACSRRCSTPCGSELASDDPAEEHRSQAHSHKILFHKVIPMASQRLGSALSTRSRNNPCDWGCAMRSL